MFQLVNFCLNGINIDLLFLFKGIHIARDIEVEVVFLYLGKAGNVGIFFDLFAFALDPHDLFDLFFGKGVLIFARYQLPTGINKEYLPA